MIKYLVTTGFPLTVAVDVEVEVDVNVVEEHTVHMIVGVTVDVDIGDTEDEVSMEGLPSTIEELLAEACDDAEELAEDALRT